MTTSLYDLAAGVFMDAKRGPQPKLHACSWKSNHQGARRAACGLTGRFVPPFGHTDHPKFPKGDDVTDAMPPPMRPLPSRQRRRHHQSRLEVTRMKETARA